MQWGTRTLALWFELSGIPQLGTGQRWPHALAVLWGPTLHPLSTEPPAVPRAGQGQQLLQGERWVLLEAEVLFQKGEWFRQRSSGLAEPKETGSAQGAAGLAR